MWKSLNQGGSYRCVVVGHVGLLARRQSLPEMRAKCTNYADSLYSSGKISILSDRPDQRMS